MSLSPRARPIYGSKVLIFALLVALLQACATGGGREIVWFEEVSLSSGNTITVERGEVRRLVAEPFQKAGWLYQGSWIEGSIPGVGPFRWETSLSPWLLDLGADKRWYMIGMSGHTSEHEYGLFMPRPMWPRYIPFRLVDNKWTRIVEHDVPIEFTKPNLLVFGETIFEPLPGSVEDKEIRQKYTFGFSNGDKLDLSLKEQLNRP